MDGAGATVAHAEPLDSRGGGHRGAAVPDLTFELRPAEDILAIDAVSFAARAAQVAAAEIFMLLEGVDPMAAVIWYQSGNRLPDAGELVDRPSQDAEIARIEAEINTLAAYVCKVESASGEQLRNFAETRGMYVLTLPWTEVPLPTRMAYSLFAETCLSVWRSLDLVQAAERAARALEAAPDNPPLKREDSIFEETESLGELIPGVLEGLAASDRERRVAVIDGPGSAAIGAAMAIGRPETD